MTTDIMLLLIILLGMMFLFVSNKAPVDLTAAAGLMLLVIFGFLDPEQAFIGFSSPAVITLLCMFFLGAALRRTGVAESVAAHICRVAGEKESAVIIAVMLVAGTLSAFMNNIAATAVLLPSIVSLAHRASIAPSKLLIPLSFATILGGTTTLIGTRPNILIADMVRDRDVRQFEFFDFTIFGVALLIVGVVYMAFWGRRILPRRNVGRRRVKGDLTKLYKLQEKLLTLRIPKGSSLEGETLASAQFGFVLDAQVLAIIRGSNRHLAPTPKTVLHEGDLLLVRGNIKNLERLLKFQGVSAVKMAGKDTDELSNDLQQTGLQLTEKGVSGWTLDELKVKKRYGVVVSAIQHGKDIIRRSLSQEPLEEGDVIHVIGTSPQIKKICSDPYFEPVGSDQSVADFLQKHLFLLNISNRSPLKGSTLRENRIDDFADLAVVGLVRNGEVKLSNVETVEIKDEDKLLVVGEPAHVAKLSQIAELEVYSEDVTANLESDDVGLVEVVLSPRSKLIDENLRAINFREKYGFQALAIWREGRPIRSRVGSEQLKFGDALLLQGPRKKMTLLAEDPDFVMLSDDLRAPRKSKRAPFAILGLVLMLVLSSFNIIPVHIAAFMAALFVVLTGAITMQDGYREVEWRIVLLVACLIPIGIAVESSGAATLIANNLVEAIGHLGPYTVMIVLSLFASLLSQTLDTSFTIVFMTPIAIAVGKALGVDPFAILMVIAMSTSIAFLTPFSHKANLLIMSPGGYRVKDYFRVGLPLTIISFLVLWSLIPLLLSF